MVKKSIMPGSAEAAFFAAEIALFVKETDVFFECSLSWFKKESITEETSIGRLGLYPLYLSAISLNLSLKEPMASGKADISVLVCENSWKIITDIRIVIIKTVIVTISAELMPRLIPNLFSRQTTIRWKKVAMIKEAIKGAKSFIEKGNRKEL